MLFAKLLTRNCFAHLVSIRDQIGVLRTDRQNQLIRITRHKSVYVSTASQNRRFGTLTGWHLKLAVWVAARSLQWNGSNWQRTKSQKEQINHWFPPVKDGTDNALMLTDEARAISSSTVSERGRRNEISSVSTGERPILKAGSPTW